MSAPEIGTVDQSASARSYSEAYGSDSAFQLSLSSAATFPGITLVFTNWSQYSGALATIAKSALGIGSRHLQFPLNATWSVIPFTSQDRLEVSLPAYDPERIYEARCAARLERRSHRIHPLDLTEADWELGYRRHREKLQGHDLALRSYVAIDRVGTNGVIQPGNRPVFGVRRGRGELRNAVRVPSLGVAGHDAASALNASEFVLIDLRNLRSPSSLQMALELVRERSPAERTIVLAKTPSEAMHFAFQSGRLPRQSISCGGPPQLTDVRAIAVNRGRLQLEREFDDLIAPLTTMGEGVGNVLEAARNAWWESQQMLSAEQPTPALDEFRRALDQRRQVAPDEARLFNAVERAIHELKGSLDRTERFEATVTEAERALLSGEVLVLVKSRSAAGHLAAEVGRAWGCSVAELRELGLRIAPFYALAGQPRHETVLASGFFGERTIDALMAMYDREVVLVGDPIELRAARHFADRHFRFLTANGLAESGIPLATLRDALGTKIIPESEAVELKFDGQFASGFADRISLNRSNQPSADSPDGRLAIHLADGLILEAYADRRFDAVDPERLTITRVKASELSPGTTIVVVHGDYQETLSDLLLDALDQGPLKSYALRRAAWLALVNSAAGQLSIADIARRMARFGYPVDRQTIRLWVMRDTDEFTKKNCPRSRNEFHAFAKALELPLPDSLLDQYFDAIRRWRIGHRLAGRQLVRAICAAALGRLDVGARKRIQNEWGGLDLQDLLEGSELAVVDSITPSSH